MIVEPACAASLAAAMGPLKELIEGKNVGLIACCSNIAISRYQTLLAA